ncbi:class III signal peptide-containing protein [uncultured Methanobrevibacter sp.]|uniref:class III signal peptide-containing protein n=1 Tax=uncultured Methanobrevibacter sp. TaxID=253161 RepID=UPI0025EAC50E|nr:class III signal peptide-containing protein [uncultured Methanobrevibacter sp.]MEE1134669.1 class III signal peptide-containing protein [Methanobrevibacter sp.]
MDNKAQASAEFILLFGGIFVVVLLAIFMYKNYMNDLTGEISSKELNEFNSQLNTLGRYFK